MKGKILVVDDLADFRKLLRDALEGDHLVSEAESGAALQKAFTQEQPDVILLDVRLPDANGLELLPMIKKRWPGTEVIVLTGAPDDSEALSWAMLQRVGREIPCLRSLDGKPECVCRSYYADLL